jgi:hypothetical protein
MEKHQIMMKYRIIHTSQRRINSEKIIMIMRDIGNILTKFHHLFDHTSVHSLLKSFCGRVGYFGIYLVRLMDSE